MLSRQRRLPGGVCGRVAVVNVEHGSQWAVSGGQWTVVSDQNPELKAGHRTQESGRRSQNRVSFSAHCPLPTAPCFRYFFIKSSTAAVMALIPVRNVGSGSG